MATKSKFVKYIDTTKCHGCRGCMITCKNWNDLPGDAEEFHGIQSHAALTADTWNYIAYVEKENKDINSGVDWFIGHKSCLHCTQASCEKVCPEGAISHHEETRAVLIDHEKCTGCGYCVAACQFDVIALGNRKVDGEEKTVASKCTLCQDRLDNGLEPACVAGCPNDSLEFGERDAIVAKAKERLATVKDRYPNANIYDMSALDDGATVYLFGDKPSTYGYPDDPKLPTAQVVWKDYALPFGKVLMGATAMAVVAGVVSNKLFNPRVKKGGDSHANVSKHE